MGRLPAAEITISWRDESGSRGQTRLYRASFTAAADIAAAVDFAQLAGGVTGCSCAGLSVLYSWWLTDARGDGPQLRQWEAVLVFATATPGQLVHVTVPGVAVGLVVAGPGAELDTTAPALAALAAGLVVAGVSNPFGYVATELLAAYVQFTP